MKILYYTSGFDGCHHYRVQMVAKYLNKLPDIVAKISYTYSNEDIDWADIVVLQKQNNPRVLPFVKYAKEKHKKIIIENDDDYFSIPSTNPAFAYYKDKKQDLIRFYKEADGITVTTPHLKKILLTHNSNIAVCPNSLDFQEIHKIKNRAPHDIFRQTQYMDNKQKEITISEFQEIKKDKVQIYWSGSPTHLEDLQQATGALIQLTKENKDILVIMGACTTEEILKNISKEQLFLTKPVPIFNYHTYLESIKADIGICPIKDNTFNHSKSNLKFLEFSVHGMPCVCSDVENYSLTVKHGETGLLSKNTDADWYANLKLMLNSEFRNKLKENANTFLLENYDIQKNIKYWLDFYNKVLSQNP